MSILYGFIPARYTIPKRGFSCTSCNASRNFAVVIVGNYTGDQITAMRSIIVTMVASLVTLPTMDSYRKMILQLIELGLRDAEICGN